MDSGLVAIHPPRRTSGEMPAVVVPRDPGSVPTLTSRAPSIVVPRDAGSVPNRISRAPTPSMTPTRRRSGEMLAVRCPPSPETSRAPLGLLAFSGFGPPPKELLYMPAYAIRVLIRSRELRRLLAIAREQRASDVSLYEASLRMADTRTVVAGFAVMAWALIMSGIGIAVAVVVRST